VHSLLAEDVGVLTMTMTFISHLLDSLRDLVSTFADVSRKLTFCEILMRHTQRFRDFLRECAIYIHTLLTYLCTWVCVVIATWWKLWR